MLNNISWAGYFYALTILLPVYYTAILLLYYRSELFQLLNRRIFLEIRKESGRGSLINQANSSDIHPHLLDENVDADHITPNAQDHSSLIVQAAIDELQAYIVQASKKELVKEQMLFSLKSILIKYPSLSNEPLQRWVNNFITAQCKNQCSMHLQEDEVSGLWRG